jgi:copper chaperone
MIQDLKVTAGPATGDAGSGCGCGGRGAPEASAGRTDGVTATYGVVGMTCAHCVASVTEELRAIDGVTSVDVDLVPGGTSVVRVVSRSPLAEPAVAEAVAEAGYELAVP